MAAFDRTITLAASPEAISTAIQASAASNELKILQPGRLMFTLRGQWGLVYILHPDGDGITRLRLLVDSEENVRSAFDGQFPRDALLGLLKRPTDTTGNLAQKAVEHLQKLKQVSEGSNNPFDLALPDSRAQSAYEAASQKRAVRPPRKSYRRTTTFAAALGSSFAVILMVMARFGMLQNVLWDIERGGEAITVEAAPLHFAYPPPWKPTDLRPNDCDGNVYLECIMVLVNGPFEDAYILIARRTSEMPADMTLADFDEMGMQNLEERDHYNLQTQTLEVDGLEAIRHDFSIPLQGRSINAIIITTVYQQVPYVVEAFAVSDRSLEQRDAVDAIVASMNFD